MMHQRLDGSIRAARRVASARTASRRLAVVPAAPVDAASASPRPVAAPPAAVPPVDRPGSLGDWRASAIAAKPTGSPTNWLALGVVGGLHAVMLIALLLAKVGVLPVPEMPPLMVDLLPDAAPVQAPPPPPQPTLDVPPPPLPQFVMPEIAPPDPAPSPITVQMVETISPPAPAAPVTAPVAAEAGPVTQPDFEADYLNNPAPIYPMAARRAREQGTVMLRVLVSPAGKAQAVELEASSGFARLDQAARDAVRRWRFVPASQSGRPITAWVLVPVIFSLNR